jgi:hypothetical protein
VNRRISTDPAMVDLYRDCYPADDPESAEAAAYLAATIDQAFNPPDGDESQEWLLARAVWGAVAYIQAQSCGCNPQDPYEDGPCDRCYVLGRIADKREDR